MFKKKEENQISSDVKTLTQRIYRNKLRIRDHLAMAILAFLFAVYVLLFKQESDLILPLIAGVGLVILSDFIAIIWHRRWIRKWRKELSEVTGIDYERLDNRAELGTDVNDLTRDNYQGFLDKLQDEEKKVIKKAQSGEQLNLIEKTLLLTLDQKFKVYLENRGLICYLKLKDINVNSLPKPLSRKERRKQEREQKKKNK